MLEFLVLVVRIFVAETGWLGRTTSICRSG